MQQTLEKLTETYKTLPDLLVRVLTSVFYGNSIALTICIRDLVF